MTKEESIFSIASELFKTDEEAFKAFDEYVKQEAIAFAKFVMDKTMQDLNSDDYWYFENDDRTFSEKTDEELYLLYLQSKNK